MFLFPVHTAYSVGKIQVSIRKQDKGKWTSLGQPLEFHNTFLLKKDRGKTQHSTYLHLFLNECEWKKLKKTGQTRAEFGSDALFSVLGLD